MNTPRAGIIRSLYNLFHNLTLKPDGQVELQGDLAVRASLSTLALANPAAPTVTPQGTTGATAYGYKLTATINGRETAASPATVINTGNAVLNGTNYNRVTWARVPGATGYKLYRTSSAGNPETLGLIATITSGATLTKDDTGLAGGGETPPTINLTGLLVVNKDLQLGSFTTTQRDTLTGVAGMLLYNSTTGMVEAYDGQWRSPGIKSKIITFTRAANAPDINFAYTGVGFKPRLLILKAAFSGLFAYAVVDGWADGSSGNSHRSVLNTAGTSILVSNDGIGRFSTQGADASIYQFASLVSYDPDGFTLQWQRIGETPQGTINIMALCIG